MKILDATCGSKSIWYDKNHPLVTYIDKRSGIFDGKTENVKFRDRRRIKINPDIVADWTKTIPFDNNYFDMIIFDPPFVIGNPNSKKNNFITKYGRLNKNSWKQDLTKGIKELFRVLKPEGIFVFKWDECNIKLNEVLKLFPYSPLFGSRIGQKNNLHWILFIKYRYETTLDELGVIKPKIKGV